MSRTLSSHVVGAEKRYTKSLMSTLSRYRPLAISILSAPVFTVERTMMFECALSSPRRPHRHRSRADKLRREIRPD